MRDRDEAAEWCAGGGCHRIAIVGSGPRGISVLERLGARLAAGEGLEWSHVHVVLIDAVQVGCGRIWRKEQPQWFLMNTVAGEISAFSGPPDGGPARPGAGPSFAQWWEAQDPGTPRADHYAPRGLYGRYLSEVVEAVQASLPEHATVHLVRATVRELDRSDGSYRLLLDEGRNWEFDRVVLVTGHSVPEPTRTMWPLRSFAEQRPQLRFIGGDSAADMALDDIPAGDTAAVIGMGLTFYDVLAALTLGRGGVFHETSGGLQYRPSGREPVLVAGSRSGMPQPARGRNQKHVSDVYAPVFFRADLVRGDAAGARVDFSRDALPRLMAEVDFVYFSVLLRQRDGRATAEAFDRAVRATGGASVAELRKCADRFALGAEAGLNFDVLSRPFDGRMFADVSAWQNELRQAIESDIAQAERGNVGSPIKAALDVLRALRWTIRDLADFGGLTARSHAVDLVEWYGPRSAFLAAGPPLDRLRQVLALMRVGVLQVVGPQAEFDTDESAGRFVVSSPMVPGSAVLAEAVIDARIPVPNLRTDSSPLARQLQRTGIWTEFINSDPDHEFTTGGVAVSRSPFHPIGRGGDPDRGLHVLGIPSEHSRWFTQVVATGPLRWSDFMRDADDVAGSVLGPMTYNTHDDATVEIDRDQVPATL